LQFAQGRVACIALKLNHDADRRLSSGGLRIGQQYANNRVSGILSMGLSQSLTNLVTR